jgi:choline kinase
LVKLNKNKYCALILSAGTGSRMKGYMNSVPKSLLKIKKQSLISRIINILKLYRIKNIYITVGYKKEKIIQHLKKIKGVNIQYIFVKNFKNVGSSYSWYLFRNKWLKKKQPVIMLHSDIYCDEKYLDSILESKKKNMIGCVKKLATKIKKEGFIVKHKKLLVTKIDHKYLFKKNKINLELACINKFSQAYMNKFFIFLRKYITQVSKKHTWEYPFNLFLKKKDIKFYINKNNNYFWYNINSSKDYFYAKKEAR